MGTDPGEASYQRPVEGGVWRFMQQVARWIADPRRKGMRAEVIPLDHLLAPPDPASIVEKPAPDARAETAAEPEPAPARRPRDRPRDDRQNGNGRRDHAGRRGENGHARGADAGDRRERGHRKPPRHEEPEADPPAVAARIVALDDGDVAAGVEPGVA
jgi:hypothetical protein